MKITITNVLDKSKDVLVLGFFEEEFTTPFPELNAELQRALRLKQIEKKFGSSYFSKANGKPAMVICLGKKKELTVERVRKALGKAVRGVRGWKYDSFATNIVEFGRLSGVVDEEKLGRATAEGLLLAEYGFKKYLHEDKKEAKKDLEVAAVQFSGKNTFNEGLKIGRVIAEATNMAREWTNEPSLIANTSYMEKMAREVVSKHKEIKIKVLQQAELEKLGLNAMVGVGKGGLTPPRLVLLEYKGAGASGKWNAIVGKGICFDSGGYNLKPTKYIEDMHTDMAGSAVVLGVMKAMAELKVKKNIVGVMALAENLIGSKAQHPGDIVKAYNGKTIQIGNTDAEGRLVLCDALAYTEDIYKPEFMIDLATLTGACVIALGYYATGMMGNDDTLQQELKKAGEESYDRVWPLPFFEEYQSLMDGDVSDLNNIQTKGKGFEAGSIAGGVFLGKFVEKAKWAHLDIAGTAYIPDETEYLPKYATGAGVRLLCYWLMQGQVLK